MTGEIVMTPAGADIFASGAAVLVNPVNCVGVSGAGLAKQFVRRFPAYQRDYQAWCKALKPSPGMTLWTSGAANQAVVHLATKDHWRNPSRIEWVEEGLHNLRSLVIKEAPCALAVPALGCGFGELSWEDVEPLLVGAAEAMARQGIKVMIYAPHDAKRGGR